MMCILGRGCRAEGAVHLLQLLYCRVWLYAHLALRLSSMCWWFDHAHRVFLMCSHVFLVLHSCAAGCLMHKGMVFGLQRCLQACVNCELTLCLLSLLCLYHCSGAQASMGPCVCQAWDPASKCHVYPASVKHMVTASKCQAWYPASVKHGTLHVSSMVPSANVKRIVRCKQVSSNRMDKGSRQQNTP